MTSIEINRAAYTRIDKNGNRLTRQQVKTLRGQVKAGDVEGAMRGLDRLLRCGGMCK
jgi:hypothetical protein